MDIFTLKLALSPLLCAFIGWLTNYLAVKMLFHPRRPVRFLFVTLHGIFPKRQQALARNLGNMVQGELISHEDVTVILQDPAFVEKIKTLSHDYVETLISEKLTAVNPMIAMFLNSQAAEKIKALMAEELGRLIPRVLEETTAELESRLDFSELVRQKVESFSMDKIEEILFAIMKKEFRFIELVGGILGFLVGLVQVAVFLL